MPRAPRRCSAASAAALALAGLVAGCGAGGEAALPRVDPVAYDGRSPRVPAAATERVLVELARPALGEFVRRRGPLGLEAQRDYVASLRREAFALRGALRSRGVPLGDVTSYTRVFNGFAATVRARDLRRVQGPGRRVIAVRRFYPAVVAAARSSALRLPAIGPRPPVAQAPVALLDSGVDARHVLLRGRVARGWDVVDGDRDARPGADPRQPAKVEQHGTELAGVLALAGERVLPLRIGGLQALPETGAIEELATTDTLLAGLEHAVDPDGDGAAADALPVALVGMNAPYGSFADAPEARAARAASALGTLVVAPAGNEGLAAGAFGTVGSPAGAPAVLGVGALASGASTLRTTVEVGIVGDGLRTLRARGALIGGAAPARPLALARAGSGETPRELLAGRSGRAFEGRLVVVARGPRPAAQAAAAHELGAAAVLIADVAARVPLPAVGGGQAPLAVVGLAGTAARRALALAGSTAMAAFSGVRLSADSGAARPSAFSSRGPALDGAPKPDLAAAGGALTAIAGAGAGTIAGSSVAAARTAVVASRLARRETALRGAALAAGVSGAARPAGAVPAMGAGVLTAATPEVIAAPRSARLRRPAGDVAWSVSRRLRLRALATGGTYRLAVQIAGARGQPAPGVVTLRPGVTSEVTLLVRGRGGPLNVWGRVLALRAGKVRLSVPFVVAATPPPAPPLGALRVQRRRGRVRGVRFSLGAFTRGVPGRTGTRLVPAARLVLELLRPDGSVVRALTPAGGAADLLPGEYAYSLPRATLGRLGAGGYRFRARVRSPAGGRWVIRSSRQFRVRAR